jgi:hydroxymethylbilane synthase
LRQSLVLGTRGSALALWQARHVALLLKQAHPGLQISEQIIRTEGDLHERNLAEAGNQGVFVRAIERKLLEERIDIAVHSMKDLPTSHPDALVIAAVPERADARDALLTIKGWNFRELPPGSVIATGSYRRRTQLLHARPDLRTEPVRGNVDSRVGKLEDGRFDALALAMAGILRLGIDRVGCSPIDAGICLPAAGQGALAVQTRADDSLVRGVTAALEHEQSRAAVEAERAFLRSLGGGCLAPATAFAVVRGAELQLKGVVGDPDGVELMKDVIAGQADEGMVLGDVLAKRMLARGAGRLLEQARGSSVGDDDR